jgi:hypothetical protein
MENEQLTLVFRAIDREVESLRTLLQQMVGTLYLNIVATDIDRLLKAKVEIQRLCSPGAEDARDQLSRIRYPDTTGQ